MKRPRPVQLRRIEKRWQKYTIRQKIFFYMSTVFLCILISVLFNVWVARFSLGDFNVILRESSQSSAFVQTIENESNLFEQFIKSRTAENGQILKLAMGETKEAIDALPFDYRQIGEDRYSITWSIRSCYEVYVEKRDVFFDVPAGTLQYVDQLYKIYDMQNYLRGYAAD